MPLFFVVGRFYSEENTKRCVCLFNSGANHNTTWESWGQDCLFHFKLINDLVDLLSLFLCLFERSEINANLKPFLQHIMHAI